MILYFNNSKNKDMSLEFDSFEYDKGRVRTGHADLIFHNINIISFFSILNNFPLVDNKFRIDYNEEFKIIKYDYIEYIEANFKLNTINLRLYNKKLINGGKS